MLNWQTNQLIVNILALISMNRYYRGKELAHVKLRAMLRPASPCVKIIIMVIKIIIIVTGIVIIFVSEDMGQINALCFEFHTHILLC